MDDFSVTTLNTPPSSSLSGPANGAVFNEGDDPFSLNATVSDPENNVSKVEFYDNGTKVFEDASAPYHLDYMPDTPGSHNLTDKAIDSYGANSTSTPRTITVRARPHISITAPEESGTYPEGTLSLNLNASDADGTVSSVDFFVDNDLVGTDYTSPFSMSWSATPGAHNFNASATDNDGLGSFEEVELPFEVEENTCSLLLPTSHKQSICNGDSVKLKSIKGSDFATSIQWQHQPTGSSFVDISNATDTTYYAKLDGIYRAIWTFTNAATCTTAVDTVVVKANPVVVVDPVYNNHWLPTPAVAHVTGGNGPFYISWSSGACIPDANQNCSSAIISDFSQQIGRAHV